MTRSSLTKALAAGVGAAAVGGVAYAAIPAGEGTITGCNASRDGGLLGNAHD